MASVQERLQMKRVPAEDWSISEQLYLASAVACSGDQNWMSVSRSLKLFCGSNRPSDWFSQKSCAAQYEMLLSKVEPTKRKKRNEKETGPTVVETPIELIVRKLTQQRIAELNKLIQEEREEYQRLRNECYGIQSNSYDDNQLREMLQQIEAEEKQREREKLKYHQWLKEREMERHYRSNAHQSPTSNLHSPSLTHLNQKIKSEEMEVDDPNAKQGTSPLLTSLLKSPSAAPNPSSSMLHNLPNQQTRVSAPTITNLLTGSVNNLSSSFAATQQHQQQQAGTKTIPSSTTAITTPYPITMHNQPLTGLPSNDHTMGNVTQSPSQAAPTLSMLLENKQKENMMKMPPLTKIEGHTSIDRSSVGGSGDATTKTEPTDVDFNSAESPIKDEEQQLMDVFNELIPDDMGDLTDIILEDLINEVNVGDPNTTEHLDNQVNLDLKNFQNQPTQQHATEPTNVVKDQPTSIINENACSSTATSTKIEDPFDELKESKNVNVENEKKVSIDIPKDDDDSDLSNDTPLSELMKQKTSAKQQRLQLTTSKEITSTTERTDENPSDAEQLQDQLSEQGDNKQTTSNEEKLEEKTIDLIDNQKTPDKQDDYLESMQTQQSNDFPIKSAETDNKPAKVEIEMPIDSFESDSNEEKSMENIKRKIEELSELKDNNSSESSQDAKLVNDETELLDEKPQTENVEQQKEETIDDNVVESVSDHGHTENAENQIDESVSHLPEKDENVETVSNEDEITDLTSNKDDTFEHNESDELACDTNAEKNESGESEKVECMEADSSQIECVESPEPESKVEEATADSTVAENIVEILDDDIPEVDDCIQDDTHLKDDDDEDKIDTDIMPAEADDLIEIKSDDEKLDENTTDEKNTKTEETNANEKIVVTESDSVSDKKEKSVTPSKLKRKVSTDDELFEDAKETLDIEVKPPKPVTPAMDTDDDSPIEVVKEEKVGIKRDYSRRKKDQTQNEKRTEDTAPSEPDTGGSISSRLRLKDRDRSESPYVDEESSEPSAKNKRRYSSTPVIDSLPNSPASSDDREYRSWKKSILLLYNSLASHRCASTFAKPITEEQAPNYKNIILNPMDLLSLKRNIDSGQIRSTIEFQRYVMLMCYNAIFYNINDEVTCSRAKEMLNDALQLIAEFLVTWKKDSEKPTAASSSSSVNVVTKSVRGRKSNRLNI